MMILMDFGNKNTKGSPIVRHYYYNQVGASWAFMERFIQIAVSWFHFPKKNWIGFRTNLMYYHKCLKISAGYGQNLIWFRNFKAIMIVHNIRSKSDPIFLRKNFALSLRIFPQYINPQLAPPWHREMYLSFILATFCNNK